MRLLQKGPPLGPKVVFLRVRWDRASISKSKIRHFPVKTLLACNSKADDSGLHLQKHNVEQATWRADVDNNDYFVLCQSYFLKVSHHIFYIFNTYSYSSLLVTSEWTGIPEIQ